MREAPPPSSLTEVKPHIITIPGKLLPPPPRKIIINREYYYINDSKINKPRSRKNTTNSDSNEAKQNKTKNITNEKISTRSLEKIYKPQIFNKTEEYLKTPSTQNALFSPVVYYAPQPASYNYFPISTQTQPQFSASNFPVYYRNY